MPCVASSPYVPRDNLAPELTPRKSIDSICIFLSLVTGELLVVTFGSSSFNLELVIYQLGGGGHWEVSGSILMVTILGWLASEGCSLMPFRSRSDPLKKPHLRHRQGGEWGAPCSMVLGSTE